MVCLYCHSPLGVSNSRPQKRSNQTWRRRVCKQCGAIFTSVESLDLRQAFVVTKEALLTPFDRDKLFLSLYESLRHRPTVINDARYLSETVIAQMIRDASSSKVSTNKIFDIVLLTLQRFDQVAATHYAAFHPHGSQESQKSQK